MLAVEEPNLIIIKPPEVSAGRPERRTWPLTLLAAVCLALFGIGLRLWLPVGFHGMGYDEGLYRAYLIGLDQGSLSDYDTITEAFLQDQRKPGSVCKLPPTRFLYIFSGWVGKRVAFGSFENAPPLDLRQPGNIRRDPSLVSLRRVSVVFSIFLLLLSGIATWRMLGPPYSLVVLALMAVAPLQLHMGGHALIDGFFSFWAMLVLWSLWENLRHPNHVGWLALYGVAIALMVITKENAFFVYAAAVGMLAINRWTQFGTVSRRLVLITVAGLLAGVAILVKLAGSLSSLFEVYHLLVTKAEHLEYAIHTGDGPWHRYLLDELLVSPMIICLAIGALLHLTRKEKPLLYLAGFLVFTCALMSQVRHGMNLRYATIWDFPLRALAAGQLLDLSRLLGRRQSLGLAIALVVICGYELWQYWIFFVSGRLYELATEDLLRSVEILK